jgi:hypothetical protein
MMMIPPPQAPPNQAPTPMRGNLAILIFQQGELVNVNVGKASYQALIVVIKNEKATIRWMTWKGLDEVQVNQLCPICDGSKRKRKQAD